MSAVGCLGLKLKREAETSPSGLGSTHVTPGEGVERRGPRGQLWACPLGLSAFMS